MRPEGTHIGSYMRLDSTVAHDAFLKTLHHRRTHIHTTFAYIHIQVLLPSSPDTG